MSDRPAMIAAEVSPVTAGGPFTINVTIYANGGDALALALGLLAGVLVGYLCFTRRL